MAGLKRQLGLAAVVAVVMGDMIGSGIFFTPGELARAAEHPWQVYFIWALCGAVVLCGALTLGELSALVPRAGATYHIMTEAFGPLAGFVKAWMEIWVSAPGSIAGVAIVFGEFVVRFAGEGAGAPQPWAVAAVALFAAINLTGVRSGGRTQVVLTAVKIAGLLTLVAGSFVFAEAVPGPPAAGSPTDWMALARFVGVGVAAVFFTYDGWTDVTHVAGEVESPGRTLPRGLGFGVLGVTLLYLVVNYAFLRIMPLATMRAEGATVAALLAAATFGAGGGRVVSGLIMLSIAGALGGLVMTAPRLVYAAASPFSDAFRPARALSWVSRSSRVPAGAIVFSAVLAVVAILFFRTFDRLVSFILVPLQLVNVLTIAAVFRLRRRARPGQYLTPGYPFVPLVFIVVMSALMANAAVYRPEETVIGVAMTAAGAPVYWLLGRGRRGGSQGPGE